MGIVVYHCFGGTHSSIIAVNLHLGILPWEKLPQKEEFLALTHFDQLANHQFGTVMPHGKDEGGNLICSLARRGQGQLAENILSSLSALLGAQVKPVNALTPLGSVARVGGFLSRRWGIVGFGRSLLLTDCLKAYPRFQELVGNTREELGLGRLPKAGKKAVDGELIGV